MEEIVKQDESTATVSAEAVGITEPIYISYDDEPKEKKSDDTLLTQLILCAVLVAVAFGMKYIDSDFQENMLSMYRRLLNAPPEEFLQKILDGLETWFKR